MNELGRRDLFRIIGTAGAVAGMEACSDMAPQPPVRPRRGRERQVSTICGACPAGCGISVRILGDNAVRVTGVLGQPVNDGGLCPRGLAEVQALYHPERVQTPLLKSGDRASTVCAPVTWDEALARVARELHGNVVFGVGSITPLERVLIDRVATKVGAQVVPVGIESCTRPVAAFDLLYGDQDLTFDLAHADLVLSLGSDWLQTSEASAEAQKTFSALRQRDPPAHLITVDGRLSTTAACSDQWVPVATSDLGFLSLTLARALIDGDGSRAQRLPPIATLLKDQMLDLDHATKRLGLPKRSIQELAQKLRKARHPVVLVDGGASVPAQLAGLILQIVADGTSPGVVARRSPSTPAVLAPTPVKWSREIRPPQGPLTVLLFKANPIYLEPRSGWPNLLERASFVASIGHDRDETALLADVVLPLSAGLESRHLTWGSTADGSGYVSAGPAAVKSLYETLDATEVLVRLARHVDPSLPWKTGDALLSAAAAALGAGTPLAKGGSVHVDVAARPLPAITPDSMKKAEEIVRSVIASPPATLGTGELALEVYVPLAFHGGLGAHLPYLHGVSGAGGRELWRTDIEIHPDTAARAGIAERDTLIVETPQGQIRGMAHLRQGIRPDTIAVAAGLGRQALGTWAVGHGTNALSLTSPGSTVAVNVRRA